MYSFDSKIRPLWLLYGSFIWMTGSSAIPFSSDQVVLTAQDGAGAVASENMECSRIGRDLLRQGGNAIDAMVGTQLCVGVTSMYHSGIGGGGFALVRTADGRYETIDFRETAPAAATQDMYNDDVRASIEGGLAVGVPSELRGLEYMHEKWGDLAWESVVMPASHLAREGFSVTADMSRYMVAGMKDAGRDFLIDEPSWAEVFAPNGTLLGVGDTMYRTRLADTLTTVAEKGASAFYTGELAASFVKTVRDADGIMTLEDLTAYRAESREPLSTTFRNHTLYTTGAPASGAITLNMLKTMEQYPLPPTPDTNLTTHRYNEAMRFAYGARSLLGDPDFVRGLGPYEASLIDDATAAHTRARISDNETQPVDHYAPHALFVPDTHGTSHVVTADSAGRAVSLTSTVNLLFGALLVDPRTGVVLNNEMNDFSIPGVRNAFGFEPSPANFIRPGKRSLSSITPVIVEAPDGGLRAVVGAAGGSRIVSATAQVLWHVLEHGMTMTEAVAEPRLHDQLMPNEVWLEYTFNNETAASLADKGHQIKWVREGLSAVQGITVLGSGKFEAASEPRQKNSGGLTA
ncbi:hypothetical protein D7B24_005605 [Verticillium nonalfalfae]|uniref:Glutathione hydrolase n=1 Tax=Verticillium nonalfalfae TaxID=1051616 RepID=A0A3M9YD29_9PEZI|nr:uncharacterized protein D7B24_005605 [Verticillium nonalfalfae]RNJ57812.1 hypothetical protein D7B24_005605 [Verticillium nonalfalfae]